jgi:acetyl-CoA acetyltransferase
MTSTHSVVIAEPVRTAIGTFGGSLKDVPAVELGDKAISAALRRANLRPDDIGTVVMGNPRLHRRWAYTQPARLHLQLTRSRSQPKAQSRVIVGVDR